MARPTSAGAEPPRFMRYQAAEEYSGISKETLIRCVRDGLLPCVKPGGKSRSRIYLDRNDLDAFLTAARRPATAGPLAPESAGE